MTEDIACGRGQQECGCPTPSLLGCDSPVVDGVALAIAGIAITAFQDRTESRINPAIGFLLKIIT